MGIPVITTVTQYALDIELNKSYLIEPRYFFLYLYFLHDNFPDSLMIVKPESKAPIENQQSP